MRWLLLFLLLTSNLSADPLKISVGAEAAILVNAQTGQVLFAKNSDKEIYPASTTKIATALFTLYKYPNELERVLTADREALATITPQAKKQSNYRSPPYWRETDDTNVGLKRGEEMSVENLLYTVLISSACDSSNVIALGLGGSIPKFVDEMNLYLKSLGCKNTFFNNPHGLHHPAHVTTAYDLAIMTREALKYPLFRKIVSTPQYHCPKTNLEPERILKQTNHLLRKGPHHYPRAIGIKTGTTQAAGKNLVAAAQEGDRVLIAVAMGYRGPRHELYNDVTKMFEAAFNEPKMRRTFLKEGEQKITKRVKGGREMLRTYLANSLAYEFYPSEEMAVKAALVWEIPPLPIKKDQAVGKVVLLTEAGEKVAEAPLFAQREIAGTLWFRLTHLFDKPGDSKKTKRIFGIALALSLLFTLWQFASRRRSRI